MAKQVAVGDLATPMIRQIAAALLEQIRGAGWVRLEHLSLDYHGRKASMPTRRRAVYLLRDLGAPITSSPSGGYVLTDHDWTAPDFKAVVVEKEIVRFAGDLRVASTKALMDELARRGWGLNPRKRVAA